jgi:hypothetical protein
MEIPFRNVDHLQSSTNLSSVVLSVQEDFDDGDDSGVVGCAGGRSSRRSRIPSWREIRGKLRSWFGAGSPSSGNGSSGGRCSGVSGVGSATTDGGSRAGMVRPYYSAIEDRECLVEIKQVPHPICFTLKVLDLTDTSVTNHGLLLILKKLTQLTSLGEYNISDNFMRSLTAANKIFRLESGISLGLLSVHTRKSSDAGMRNLVQTMPRIRSLTCWEPQFELEDLCHLHRLRHVTLLRISFNQDMMEQILRLVSI